MQCKKLPAAAPASICKKLNYMHVKSKIISLSIHPHPQSNLQNLFLCLNPGGRENHSMLSAKCPPP